MITPSIQNWLFFLMFVGIVACTRDTVAPPEPCENVVTYDGGIREIVRSKCNFSGCHDGSSGVGNYNTYQGIQRVLGNNSFRQEVVISKNMPKSGSITAEEFEALKCWSENGYPEN